MCVSVKEREREKDREASLDGSSTMCNDTRHCGSISLYLHLTLSSLYSLPTLLGCYSFISTLR